MVDCNRKKRGKTVLNILIADDEKKVGLLVKELINWNSLELSLLDIVQDGQQAYEIILQKKPDIVITDIRMPNLSGLELIKKVTEANIPVHFIVISGYRYFDYAQTAIKYGVEDYLLKPIDEVELNKILNKVCEEEMQKRKEYVQVRLLQKKFQDSKHVLHRELMDQIFSNNENLDVEKINEEYGVDLEEGIFRAIGIKVDRNIRLEKNKQQEKLIIRKLEDLVNEKFQNKVIDLVVSGKRSMIILILLNYRDNIKTEIDEDIKQLFCQMKNYINDFETYEITMGLSNEILEFKNVNLALEMVKEALNCRIFEGTGKCIENYSKNRNQNVKAQNIIKEYQEEIIKNINIADGGKLAASVEICFKKAEEEHVFACEFYALADGLFGEYCEQVTVLFKEDMMNQYKEWVEESEHCKTVFSLRQYVQNVFRRHLCSLNEKRKEVERRPILEAIKFIKQNYSQKILLDEVAEKLGFNTNYFSEIFKNETGKNFSTYLLEVRMAEAKILLRDSTDTIYEIASKVGYKDSKFFSQQFTKVVGIKPVEYRKLYY